MTRLMGRKFGSPDFHVGFLHDILNVAHEMLEPPIGLGITQVDW
jgi:hypothetical protein